MVTETTGMDPMFLLKIVKLLLGMVEVVCGAEKVNALNYLAKPPPPIDECYYEEDSYAVNE